MQIAVHAQRGEADVDAVHVGQAVADGDNGQQAPRCFALGCNADGREIEFARRPTRCGFAWLVALGRDQRTPHSILGSQNWAGGRRIRRGKQTLPRTYSAKATLSAVGECCDSIRLLHG